MSGPAIDVAGLTKDYQIGTQPRYLTLRDSLAGFFGPRAQRTSFRALDGVSFHVPRGEVLGVIGRNGAGKSTLLRVLSRITDPTAGRIILNGRVGSLLEVGTGFHPELTGRENIFLNGVLIGMSRAEIRRRFEAIVDFADIGAFLDTQVKRYSSGMQMRLAFAVAAHLDAEILLMDEVLAVGDAEFQRRCLGRVAELARDGRTIVFVSHNLGAVRNLCTRALWLDRGRVVREGGAAEVVAGYLTDGFTPVMDGLRLEETVMPGPRGQVVFRWQEVVVRQVGTPGTVIFNGQSVDLRLRFTVGERIPGLRVYFDLCDEDQGVLMRTFHDEREDRPAGLEPGTYTAVARIPADLLADRPYWLVVQATIHNVGEVARPIPIRLEVHRSTAVNRAYPQEPIRARLLPQAAWSLSRDA